MADSSGRGPRALLVPQSDFLVLVKRALARRGQTGADVAMVAVGIEEAAHANGADCRPAGDALLDAVAELIAENPGPGEAVTVTDSGELMILCGQVGGSWAADSIVRRAQDIAARPVQVGGVPVPVVAVSGVAMASCPQDTAEALVAMAGRAMRAQRATPLGMLASRTAARWGHSYRDLGP